MYNTKKTVHHQYHLGTRTQFVDSKPPLPKCGSCLLQSCPNHASIRGSLPQYASQEAQIMPKYCLQILPQSCPNHASIRGSLPQYAWRQSASICMEAVCLNMPHRRPKSCLQILPQSCPNTASLLPLFGRGAATPTVFGPNNHCQVKCLCHNIVITYGIGESI
jgi:hypothetical protein